MARGGHPAMSASFRLSEMKQDDRYDNPAYPTATALLPALRLSHKGQTPGASSPLPSITCTGRWQPCCASSMRILRAASRTSSESQVRRPSISAFRSNAEVLCSV